MKKKSLKFKIIVSVAILAVLVVSGVVAYNIISRHSTTAVEKVSSTAMFNFNDSKAPGWFAGANIDGAAVNATTSGKKLGTVMRNIAQGTSAQPTGNCFVSYSYWANTTKDLDRALAEVTAPSDSSTSGSYTLEPTNTATYVMNISGKDTAFQLHQYNITGPDAAQMSDGVEYAFIKAGTGYIEINGYCKTADELSITLPVIAAVSFRE